MMITYYFLGSHEGTDNIMNYVYKICMYYIWVFRFCGMFFTIESQCQVFIAHADLDRAQTTSLSSTSQTRTLITHKAMSKPQTITLNHLSDRNIDHKLKITCLNIIMLSTKPSACMHGKQHITSKITDLNTIMFLLLFKQKP